MRIASNPLLNSPCPVATGQPARLWLALPLVGALLALGACGNHGHHQEGSGSAASVIVVHHENGTSETLTLAAASTPANAGATVPATATPVVPDRPITVASTSTLWMLGNRAGAAQLGEIYQIFADSNVTKVAKTFTGRPWTASTEQSSHSLVFNPTDGRFYGVIDSVGLTYGAAVLYSFDPTTDDVKMLKTLSNAGVGQVDGLGGTTVQDFPRTGFLRKPLLSADGKSIILIAQQGGRDDRGLLIHINLDPASARYLQETVVYEFFSYEKDISGNYCDALIGPFSEMTWGKDSGGQTVAYLGRQGESYKRDNPKPTYPADCSTAVVNGAQIWRKPGRVFALRPSDAADLSKPWAFVDLGRGGYSLPTPESVRLGRLIFFDTRNQSLRWTTEDVSDGMLTLHSGSTGAGSRLYFSRNTGCYDLIGLLPLDTQGNGILGCSGINGSSTLYPGITDQTPMIFTDRVTTGDLSFETPLSDWYTGKLTITGATFGEQSRRLFLTGGNDVEGRVREFGDPSRIDVLNPGSSFARQRLVRGDVKTTGRGFFGDPATGGAGSEPLPDRYVVWLGTLVSEASMTLNKYDRFKDTTTTIRFETDAGAHPWGKLLDLGNGLAMGRIENTPPYYGTRNPDKVGGYRGASGWGNIGSRPGLFTIDIKTGQIRTMAAQEGSNFSPELARTDGGKVWGIRYEGFGSRGGNAVLKEELRLIDADTGKSQILRVNDKGQYSDAPQRRLSPEARGPVVYGGWLDSLVSRYPLPADLNEKLLCQRADDTSVFAYSALFGPSDQTSPVPVNAGGPLASSNHHAIVEGPTYSPTHNALYMATRLVGNAPGLAIFEIDKDVPAASLCRQAPVFTRIITSSAAADVPVTKILATRLGVLVYGTDDGRLMKVDPVARSVSVLADLKAGGAAASRVKGFLTEIADGVIGAVVYDYDAQGRNIGRRLAGVSTSGTQVGSHDVTNLITGDDPYPGVNRFN